MKKIYIKMNTLFVTYCIYLRFCGRFVVESRETNECYTWRLFSVLFWGVILNKTYMYLDIRKWWTCSEAELICQGRRKTGGWKSASMSYLFSSVDSGLSTSPLVFSPSFLESLSSFFDLRSGLRSELLRFLPTLRRSDPMRRFNADCKVVDHQKKIILDVRYYKKKSPTINLKSWDRSWLMNSSMTMHGKSCKYTLM